MEEEGSNVVLVAVREEEVCFIHHQLLQGLSELEVLGEGERRRRKWRNWRSREPWSPTLNKLHLLLHMSQHFGGCSHHNIRPLQQGTSEKA